MLTSLALENFKAFGEQQRLPLRPVTLLFGANSAGKSSIIQSLLLLKQTLEDSESADNALLPKGKLVNLGSFREMAFRHDTAQSVQFTLGIQPRKDVRRVRPDLVLPPDVERSLCSFAFSVDDAGSVTLSEFKLVNPERPQPILVAVPTDVSQGDFEDFWGPIAVRDQKTARAMQVASVSSDEDLYARVWQRLERTLPEERASLQSRLALLENQLHQQEATDRPRLSAQGLDEEASPVTRERLTRDIVRERDLLREMYNRISSLNFDRYVREMQQRYTSVRILLNNFLPTTFGTGGRREPWPRHTATRRFIDELPLINLTYRRCNDLKGLLDRIVYLGPLREYPERHYIFSGNLSSEVGKSGKNMPDLLFKNSDLVRRVDGWLSRFGVQYELRVQPVKDEDVEDVFTLRLVDKVSGVSVSTLDVGFGISQILPIVTQSLFSRNRIVLVEQPEIHLHPKLQAEFGSLLAEAVRSNSNQFIIETHSEHLVLRIQRLIRRGELRPDEVAVVYVRRTECGSDAAELRLNSKGEFIDRWPEGFFEEGFAERFAD